MINLTSAFERASHRQSEWSEKPAALVAVTAMSRSADLHVDWDRGAGERWMRLVADSAVLLLIGTRMPLVFAVVPSPIWVEEWVDSVEIIETESFDDPQYASQKDSLEMASPGLAVSRFSVMDLWFASV